MLMRYRREGHPLIQSLITLLISFHPSSTVNYKAPWFPNELGVDNKYLYKLDFSFISTLPNFHNFLSSSSSSSYILYRFFILHCHKEMSSQVAPEHVCYVQCNFCNTILAVNVPGNNLLHIVTVRCGHCANLLPVNMGALLQAIPLQNFQKLQNQQIAPQDTRGDCSSSSKCNRAPPPIFTQEHAQQRPMLPIRPPEKRQRVPSAYNRFIKEEIQRIKSNNPDISHREAFSAAAKNWAHFPHIHFGLSLDGNKQTKLDEAIAAHGGGQKSQGLY